MLKAVTTMPSRTLRKAREATEAAKRLLHNDSSVSASTGPFFDSSPCDPNAKPEDRSQRCGRLCNKTLDSIDDDVVKPKYCRDGDAKNYILHIGLGGFFRSHQAVYLDKLLNKAAEKGETSPSWGLCAVSWNDKKRDLMRPQDNLYTVWSRDKNTEEVRVVGSILDWLDMSGNDEEKKAGVERLAEESTKLVTLTVTEKGYYQKGDGDLDVDSEKIQHDLKNMNAPLTPIGYIAAGLKLCKERSIKPFTVMSCDNLPGNSSVLRKMVIQFTEAAGEKELKTWIENEVAFPACVVDRITPKMTDEHQKALAERFGVHDAFPVVAEDFTMWAVEDNFPSGRPQWEDVGVKLVDSVEAPETVKLRLLNGGHFAMAFPALLSGHEDVTSAAADDKILKVLNNYMCEVFPGLPDSKSVDPEQFSKDVVRRFKNPHMKDSLTRIVQDSSQKFANQMRFGVTAALDKCESDKMEGKAPFTALSLASWISVTGGNGDIDYEDPMIDELKEKAKDAVKAANSSSDEGCDAVKEFLKTVCEDDFGSYEGFVKDVAGYLGMIGDKGIAESIDSISDK